MVQHVVNMLSHTEFPNPEIDIPHQLVWIADSLTVDAALLCLLGAGILKPCAARPPCAVTVSSGYSTLNPSRWCRSMPLTLLVHGCGWRCIRSISD